MRSKPGSSNWRTSTRRAQIECYSASTHDSLQRIERELTMARILLVEDDDQLRSMLKLLLTDSGYEVWEAPDGTRVCQMHDQKRFDLVITDLLMPAKDGLEVIIDLRRKNQNVRIIAM